MKVFFALASAVWRYSAGHRWRIVVYLGMFAIANILYLFEPYAVGLLLNNIQNSVQDPNAFTQIVKYLIILLSLTLGFWLFHGPARVIERVNAFHMRNTLNDHLFRIITSLPLQWHKQHHSGQTINRTGKAKRALYDFAENSYQLVEMILRPAAAIVALLLIMPMAAAIAAGIGVTALFLVFAYDRILLPIYDEINLKEHFIASALHDYITNITTVITLRLEQLTRNEIWYRTTHFFPLFRREAKLNEWKWFSATLVIASMTFCVLTWYAYTTVGRGIVPLTGTFFMLYEYLQKIGSAFYTFAWKYSQMVQQYADLKSIDPILEAAPADYGTSRSLPKDWCQLHISNLNFVYQDEEKREHHLHGISMTIGRRAKIALVGESGSGKSTLMSIIRGLHIPEHIDITCDGKPLPHATKDIASCVTLIPQEPEIFENTIEYNITLDTDQPFEEVMEDVRLASFDSVLEKLPQGIKTNTAEKGVNLSGGEKQRLALARGFFAAKDSDIILLDEPTSSVDSTNEIKIYRNIMERFADRCIISSIHKLHLLEFFDEVYVLGEGKVIEHGTPQELLNGQGSLAALWKRYSQAQKK